MYVPVGMTVRIRGAWKAAAMSMRRGIAGPEFDQFKAIIARNHAMRMRGIADNSAQGVRFVELRKRQRVRAARGEA